MLLIGTVMIADQVLQDLEGVAKMFRRKVLSVLEVAVKEKGKASVEWEELIWETRKLRRRAGKALGGK